MGEKCPDNGKAVCLGRLVATNLAQNLFQVSIFVRYLGGQTVQSSYTGSKGMGSKNSS